MSNHTTMRTVSGNRMDLLDPSAESVSLLDISFSLCRIKRFTGHTTISVAQHSIEVMMAVYARPDFPCAPHVSERMALMYALLHDAHEAYTGDISRPMNNAIAAVSVNINTSLLATESPINPIKRDVQRAIHSYFNLPYDVPPVLRDAIGVADRKMLNIDRWLFKVRWGSLTEEQARGQFMRTVEALLKPDGASFVGQFDDWPGNENEQILVGDLNDE